MYQISTAQAEDIDTMPKSDLYLLHHYYKNFGGHQRLLKGESSRPDLTDETVMVAECPPSSEGLDWAITYATVGLNRVKLSKDEPVKVAGIEILLLSNQVNTQVSHLLFEVAWYVGVTKFNFGLGDNLLHEKPLIEGSPMRSLIFQPPLFYPENLWTYQRGNNYHVHLLWAIPVYETEKEFFKKEGMEALGNLFNEEGVDLADFLRPPVV
jgi:Suppressor of fused protein (SUFU)